MSGLSIPANKLGEIEDILFRPPGRPSLGALQELPRPLEAPGLWPRWSTPRRVCFPRPSSRTCACPSRSLGGSKTSAARPSSGSKRASRRRTRSHRFRAPSAAATGRSGLQPGQSRRLGLPSHKSMTSLQQRLMKTGGRLVKHARYLGYWPRDINRNVRRHAARSGRCHCRAGRTVARECEIWKCGVAEPSEKGLPTDELSPSENERVRKHFGPARCVPAVKKGLPSRENERRIEAADPKWKSFKQP